jgi:hypothetical protein
MSSIGKLKFEGHQYIEKGKVKLGGYMDILEKINGENSRVPVLVKMTMLGKKGSTYDALGSISQPLPGQPSIEFYANLGEGKQMYYHLERYKLSQNKLIYFGKCCDITPDNLQVMAKSEMPKTAKRVSLEFLLETEKDRLLIAQMGISK